MFTKFFTAMLSVFRAPTNGQVVGVFDEPVEVAEVHAETAVKAPKAKKVSVAADASAKPAVKRTYKKRAPK